MARKIVITDRRKFPKCIRSFPELKGICIGRCIHPKLSIRGPDKKTGAHAHSAEGYEHTGWICLRWEERMKEPLLLLHEMAHLLANKKESTPHHGKNWKAQVLQIGGTTGPYHYHHKKKTNYYPGYDSRGHQYYEYCF